MYNEKVFVILLLEGDVMKILVTGGAGYIGSHTCVELLNSGYEVIVIDNFCNSKKEVIDKIKKITNKDVMLYEGNVCDKKILREIFKENQIEAVIHFAGLKAVGESVKKPLLYYRNNIDSTLSLCEVMEEFDCKKLIFSSSATVYGDPKKLPITEDMEVGNTTNPYGSTKLYIEGILKDIYVSSNTWKITLLRYFNPIGAHKSGLIGENPNGIPNNLMPYIVKVACGELEYLNVFGNTYDTVDGTGVRDYIHVVDLAKGHVKALEKLNNQTGVKVYNLGTGNGYSVLQIVDTFSKVNNIKVNYKIVDKREGDIATCYADATLAEKELGWKAELGLEDMVKSSYYYAINNKK